MKEIKKTKKCCDTCKFQFYGTDGICAGKEYGKPMEEVKKLYPNGCEEWGISFEAYSEYCDQFEK